MNVKRVALYGFGNFKKMKQPINLALSDRREKSF